MYQDAVITALTEHKLFILTAHVFGTVLGVGGATVADILFFRFLSDYRISAKECDVLTVLKKVILSALLVIIASGVALYLTDIERYSASAQFLVKMTIVGVITVNGIALHFVVAPHLLRIDMKRYHVRYRLWRRLAFAFGAVSACSWYSAFFIAMLKTILPAHFGALLSSYVFLLMIAVTVSQIIERRLTAMSRA